MIVTAMTAIGCTDRLAAEQTDSLLPVEAAAAGDAAAADAPQPAFKVIAARVLPRDEVLLKDERVAAAADATAVDSDSASWELRSEVIRVGLADAVATFDAMSAAQQEALYKAHEDELQKSGVNHYLPHRFSVDALSRGCWWGAACQCPPRNVALPPSSHTDHCVCKLNIYWF